MSSSQERTAKSFVERHGLWSDEQFEAAANSEKWIEERGLEVVRLSFADQHGILRGKTVMANEAPRMMRNGCSITTTLLAKDTAHKTVFPVFTPGGGFGMPEMEGAADFLMIPDPTTFRVLPGRRARVGCCATCISAMDGQCRSPRAIFIAAPWQSWRTPGLTISLGSNLSSTFSSSTTRACDPMTPPGRARRRSELALTGLCLSHRNAFRPDGSCAGDLARRNHRARPAAALDRVELGPSQCEFTFNPQVGLSPADSTISSAVPSNRAAGGKVFMRVSCAARRWRIRCQAAGTCTSR